MKIYPFFSAAIILLLFSCNQQEQQINAVTFDPKVVEAHGYVVPKESIAEPRVIFVDRKKLKKNLVGVPKVVLINNNVHLAGIPKVVRAGVPKLCTPGQDNFSYPKTVPIIDSPFIAGIPEVVIAKEAVTKDQNPENFTFFNKLQGLKYNQISCLLEDKSGNLWLGTNGGGVSKYDGKSFTHFTEKEGLSNNVVKSILEDKTGNIWFGTLGGVSKYDGKRFTRFKEKDGLINNNIWCIMEGRNGNIWFGTPGGVSYFEGKKATHFTDKEGLINKDVRSILEDEKGNIWFGTYGGVSKYDGKSFTHFTVKEGLSNNDVNKILKDKSGNFWFCTLGGGVNKYDGKSFTHFTVKEGLSNDLVNSMTEDKSGILWIGTFGGGVSKYDGKSFTHFTEKDGLSNNNVSGILQDKSGNLWFSTLGGVSKYDLYKEDGKRFSHFTDKEGLSHNIVRSIIEDKSGNLWFGTLGGGVNKYDGKSFTQFRVEEGLSNNNVWSIQEDKSGNLWFGTYGGGVNKYDGKSFIHFTDKDGMSSNDIRCILEDKSGNLWFGTAGDGVSKYDGRSLTHFTTREGLSHNSVRCILEDERGNLWFGTGGGGVTKYDGKSFTHFTVKEGLSNNFVWSILEDKSGNLWFGTAGGGVCKYDGRNFTHFTDKEGLSNNDVRSIMEDNNNLWFGTLFGLNKLEKDKLFLYTKVTEDNDANTNGKANKTAFSLKESDPFFKSYLYEDGFSGIGVNQGKTIHESKAGIIWIGADDRLTTINPGMETKDTMAPNIQLTGISLFNENIAWQSLEKKRDSVIVLGNGVRVHDFHFDSISKWYDLPMNLSLPHNNNYLTFQFVGITTQSPKKVKYQYKLEGLDKNWSTVTARNEAPYGNLPHGRYTFKIKAMNGGGYWSKELDYTFTIRPPWWKTWWFRTLVGITLLFLLYGFYRWRTASLRKQKRVLEETVKVRTAEVVEEKAEVGRQKDVIQKEKEKSEELLLNILPSEVAEELKEKGYTTAKSFDEVTVLFSDIKGFTNVAEKMTAQQLVKEINTYFSAFDNIILKYGLEKIKTIGDAYIAAGGLPEKNAATAQNVIEAAIAMQQEVEKLKQERISLNKPYFELRIGIHTGPVVAGVVGIKKFQYDIWGDTVNLAARMEQSGVPGKINISQQTYQLVKEQFTCVHRGKIEAKNKGDIDMYFVEQ